MTSVYLYRRTCCLRAALFIAFCFDPVFAQSGGINWEAVGISWVLSAVTTCLLIAAAFGIRGCLKHGKNVKTSNDDEADVERMENGGERQRLGASALDQNQPVTSLDKLNSGLLSVSQQSAYLRAQNDTGKNRKKNQPRPRVKTEQEPRDWVEQWCEEQAKRDSVVAALKPVDDSPVPGANTRDDHLLRYPAGLDLPSTDVRQSTRNDRNKDVVKKRTGSSAFVSTDPKELQPVDFRKETALQRPSSQNFAAGTRALENKQMVRNSNHFQVSTPKMDATAATEVKAVSRELFKVEALPPKTASNVPVLKSQQLVVTSGTIEELKDSPVRVRKHQRDAQKRSDLPQLGVRTQPLEFRRPPNELDPSIGNETAFHNRWDQFHKETVPLDKGEAKSAPSQKQEGVTSSEEEEEATEEEEESDKEPVDPTPLRNSNPPAVSEAKETVPSSQKRGVKRSLSPSADPNESPEATTAVRPTKSSTTATVGSTPPTSDRPASVRRATRQSKPPVLNIVPVPADGVSPPPGLLPLTASSHHQVMKSQRPAAAAAVSQVVEEKRGRKAAKENEEKGAERRKKSSKKDKSKERPPSFDFKNKRASTGSDILFFAPELQGTSTPAMRPKSAFIPASVPLLSHDTGDDDDDGDERQQGARGSKAGAVTSSFRMQKPQLTNVSQNKQFHGLLSDSGLHELAHSVSQEWRQLANSLHVSAELQARLVTSHSNDAEKCTYVMLRGWRDRFTGSKAELRSLLCNALVAANHPEMAEKLIQEEMVGSSERLDNLKLVSVV